MNPACGITLRQRNPRLIRFGLPLMTLALCLPMSSAAASFVQGAKGSSDIARQERRVVARGRLTGAGERQRVVTWRTEVDAGSGSRKTAHLAIETSGSKPRTLWQADETFPAIEINSVRVADLDGDGLAEVIGLWWQGASIGARLRIFHWEPTSHAFVELRPKADELGLLGIHGYRLRGPTGHQRIIVYTRATATGWPPVASVEFEVRGSAIVRAGAGASVTAPGESGIEGQAVISPVRPGPVREGQSDTAGYKTTLVVWRVSDGSEVTRLETGSDGRFRVSVPPGTYKVGPPTETGRFLPRAAEEIVTVAPGKFARVTISFDSGIR